MFKYQTNDIRYKWDPNTCTGYRLRYDDLSAKQGWQRDCYHVEDWDHNCMVGDWGCNTLEEALMVLCDFFDIDVAKESDLLKAHFPQPVQ